MFPASERTTASRYRTHDFRPGRIVRSCVRRCAKEEEVGEVDVVGGVNADWRREVRSL
jgi:hypothetical protein